MGSARGFRLRDPFDGNSGASSAIDQQIGIGDGAATRFAIVKHYGAHRRRITRPVTGSVRVAVDGEETAAFTIEPGGGVALGEAPADRKSGVEGKRVAVRVEHGGGRSIKKKKKQEPITEQ